MWHNVILFNLWTYIVSRQTLNRLYKFLCDRLIRDDIYYEKITMYCKKKKKKWENERGSSETANTISTSRILSN